MIQNKNNSEAFEILKEYLVQNNGAKVARGGREIIKRCHICGDSRDLSDAHMYIGMNNGVIVYNCFKCNNSGVVDGNFLRNIGCYDPNILAIVQEQNKTSISSNPSYLGSTRMIRRSELAIPLSNNEYAMKKLSYLNNRLGPYFDLKDLPKYKIILNLKDFLDINNITRYTRNPELVDLLDKFFIGFLSADGSYVILRRLVPEGKLPQYIDTRYVNYNIFGTNTGNKMYIIPTFISIHNLYNAPISVHIAEGCFDILSIAKMTEEYDDKGNYIFMAVCGKSYMSAIEYIINAYGFINLEIHLYPDNDVNDYEIKKITDKLQAFRYIKLFSHRNEFPGEKDFGVARDRIQMITQQFK